ncbi:MAG: hypothetical protein IPK25_02195 [Saprospiraceae bacterium]|nr:hypothetical protein [Saprospiraceae bacterium]
MCRFVVGSPGTGAWRAYLDGHKIINISFSGSGLSNSQVNEMLGEGVVITAAAFGNNNTSQRAMDGFIHVGAVNAASNYIDYSRDWL